MINSINLAHKLRVYIEILPGVGAWDTLREWLKQRPENKLFAVVHAGAADTAALQQLPQKPKFTLNLTQPDVWEPLKDSLPETLILPRLVAPELSEAENKIYTANIINLLQSGFHIETTFPMIAYQGVNDTLNPPIEWPSQAQVNGTFLRQYVHDYVLCDTLPQTVLNLYIRNKLKHFSKVVGKNAKVVNLINLHRLREFMLRLVTAHAADKTRETLTPREPQKINLLKLPNLYDWHWNCKESLLAIIFSASILIVCIGLLWLKVVSFTGVILILVGTNIALIPFLQTSSLLLASVVTTFGIVAIYNFLNVPIIPHNQFITEITITLIVLWGALFILKTRTNQDQKDTQTQALLRLVYDIGRLNTPAEIIEKAHLNLKQSLGLQSYYWDAETLLMMPDFPPEEVSNAEQATQTNTIQHPKSEEGIAWCPVPAGDKIIGALGLKHTNQSALEINYDMIVFLRTYSRLLGGALRRVELENARLEASTMASHESLRSALLASVSHDLKTPLVGIIGSLSTLSLVKDKLPLRQRMELIHGAQSEAERLNRMVQNVLEMAKLESGPFIMNHAPLRFIEQITATAERVKSQYPGWRYKVSSNQPNPQSMGDELLISQVFYNLLENAAKYGEPGSPTHVEIVVEETTPQITLRFISYGKPVPEENIEKIFDKFFRSQHQDSKTAGSGLGLAICRAIVEAHGGNITASRLSTPKLGMVFEIRLPISVAEDFTETLEGKA